MFCANCGTALAADARFCQKCGKPVVVEETQPEPSPAPTQQITDPVPEKSDTPPAEHPPMFAWGRTHQSGVRGGKWDKVDYSRLWLGLIFLSYAAVMLIAMSGPGSSSSGSAFPVSGLMFWSALAFWYSWKVRGYKGWVGALIGVAVGFVVSVAFFAISSYKEKQQPDYALEHTQPYPEIKKAFPQEYEEMRAAFIAAMKTGDLKVEDGAKLLRERMMPLLARALQTTSETALQSFAKAQLRLVGDIAKSDAAACVAMLTGASVDVSHVALVTAENKERMNKAVQKVFENVGKYRPAGTAETNASRFADLLAQVDKVVAKKHSMNVADLYDESKSAEQRCAAGRAIYDEIFRMSADDKDFMLRQAFAPASDMGVKK